MCCRCTPIEEGDNKPDAGHRQGDDSRLSYPEDQTAQQSVSKSEPWRSLPQEWSRGPRLINSSCGIRPQAMK
jgi:hypothetical protein